MNKLPAILVLIATALPVALSAAVPLRWTVETNRIQPAQFEAYHGEALEFEATFNSLGKPLALDSHTATLYYQTNGMDQAWWSFPASVSGNVARAVFTPAMDPAAKQITVFLGVSAGPSNQNYRASASVRFRNSPGAAPGWIEPPVVKLDFSTIETLNAPWFTKDESNDRFPVKSAVYTKTETDAALSDKQDIVSDLASIRSGAALGATAVQPSAIGDMETKTHAAATYQPKGSYLTSESDPTVDGKISTHNSSSSAHADIRQSVSAKYSKPSSGIPKTDLASAVQTSLGKADSAVQPAAISDMETKTHAAATYQPKGSYLTSESDPTVDGKISTHNSSTSAHSDIRTALAGKQPTISDLATIRSGAALGATAVQPAAISDMETQTHASATYQPKGSYLTSESDPTVDGKISTHNSSTSAHSDIRTALAGKQPTISDLASIRSGAALGATALQSYTETDPTISAWAKAMTKPNYTWTEIGSKPTFAAVATSGAYSDLTGKPSIPTDSTVAGWGYIKSWAETDPTVPSWAKATSKPTYTWTEISNKPSWIGNTKPSYTWTEIESKPTFAAVATSGAYSDLTGKPSIPTDSTVAGWGYIKSWTETDPTVPSWAKATSKPTYTWTEISNKPSWIGSSKPSYTWTEIGSKPTTFTPSAHTHTQSDVTGLADALAAKVDGDSFQLPLKHESASPSASGTATLTTDQNEFRITDMTGSVPQMPFRVDPMTFANTDVETYGGEPCILLRDGSGGWNGYGWVSGNFGKARGWYVVESAMPVGDIIDISEIEFPLDTVFSFNYSQSETWTFRVNWTVSAKEEKTSVVTDSAPTAGSGNLLTSGAIKTALDTKLPKADVIKQSAVTTSTPDGKAADAKDLKNQLAGKQEALAGLTQALVSWLSTFKGSDTATTLASLLSALSGKLDKVGDADYGTKVFWDSDGMTLKVKGNMRVNPDGDFAGLYVPQAQNVDDDEVWNIGQIRGEFEGYSWDWSAINNTPTTLAGYGIEDASISGNTITLGSHSSTIPTALKCPNSLTIKLNGTTAATYDGSAARTVDITTGGGAPGATVASAALEYHADGQAISVSVAAAGTLTAVVNSWTDGQSQMAFVTLAAGASIAPAIKLIGYSEWPIGEEFMAVCTKRGSKIYVNPVCITEE